MEVLRTVTQNSISETINPYSTSCRKVTSKYLTSDQSFTPFLRHVFLAVNMKIEGMEYWN